MRLVDVTFGILGRTALRIDGTLQDQWGEPRLGAMLAALLVNAGRFVTVDSLVEWVWPETAALPQDPTSTFHTYATRIRRSLQRVPHPPTLQAKDGSYRLNVDRSLIDYHHFRTLIGQTRAHSRAGHHQEAADCARCALQLWRGRPLEGMLSEPARAWRTRVLLDEWVPANIALIEALVTLGEFAEALARVDDLQADHPTDVTLATLRLSALHGMARHLEGTAYYLESWRRLRDEADEQGARVLQQHHERLQHPPARVQTHKARDEDVIPRGLPLDIQDFVGRASQLAALDAATRRASTNNTGGVIVVDGMAGVGKTALLVHWGHLARNRFPDGELYMDLKGFSPDTSVAPSVVVDEFLLALGWPYADEQSSRMRAASLQRLLANRRMLIVLDNAFDTAHVQQVVGLLGTCVVVVTSRRRLTALHAATGAHRVHVEPMTTTEATQMFNAHLGDHPELTPPTRAAVAGLCDGVPHLIRILSHHIASGPATDIAAFARRLDRRQLLTDIGEDSDGSVTANTLLSWTYRTLDPPEQRLFRLLGASPTEHITEAATQALDGRPLPHVRRSLRVLGSLHLLTQPDAFDEYRLPALIREFARHRAEQEDPRTTAITPLVVIRGDRSVTHSVIIPPRSE
jgi:DNA-binding SARP family transcriptional activator